MNNYISKITSALIVIVLLFTVSFTSLAEEKASLEDYKAVNSEQKEYYNNTYKPVYYNYLNSIKDFRSLIKNTTFKTDLQAKRVVDYLNYLVKAHKDFYGERTTKGKSRYDVPYLREAMYKAADKDKDFNAAIELCKKLRLKVQERVNYMNGVISSIQNFNILLDKDYDDDYLAFANALKSCVANYQGEFVAANIRSNAQNIEGTYANAIAKMMKSIGFDATKFNWYISSVRVTKKVNYILISNEFLGEVGTKVNCVKIVGSTITHGTASVVIGSCTDVDGNIYNFKSINSFK